MNAERLLKVYEQISEAPDAIARLRRFVLDLAVRGKLVEQDAGDEPASQLLEQIAVEKAKLVSSGHIKAPKPQKTKSAIEADFAIPSGWVWTSLGTVAACLDFMRKPINGTERDKRIDGLPQDKLYPYFGATQQQGWIDDFIFDDDLILLGEDGVPFHDPLRNKAYKISGKTWVNNHAHVFKCILTSIDFVAHYLNVFDYSGRVVGATRAKLNQARALTIPIPLPPLAEQHRIVAKVDELMALCDRLEDARKTREEVRDKLTAASLARLTAPDTTAEDFPTHAAFALEALPALTTRPDQIKTLRQTILNLAVRGKLVEQDPAEEAIKLPDQDQRRKAEGKLELDLPANWQWASVSEVADARLGKMLDKTKNRGKPFPYLGNTNVHWFDIKTDNLKTILLTEKEAVTYLLEEGDVLICEGGHGIGRTAVWRGQGNQIAFQKALHRVRPTSHLNSDFFAICSAVYYDEGVMQTYFTGVGIPHFTGKALARLLFPLPPLAEQNRIVAKVGSLMTLCDRLEGALTTADTTRTRLLEALLHEALEPASDVLEAAE